MAAGTLADALLESIYTVERLSITGCNTVWAAIVYVFCCILALPSPRSASRSISEPTTQLIMTDKRLQSIMIDCVGTSTEATARLKLAWV